MKRFFSLFIQDRFHYFEFSNEKESFFDWKGGILDFFLPMWLSAFADQKPSNNEGFLRAKGCVSKYIRFELPKILFAFYFTLKKRGLLWSHSYNGNPQTPLLLWQFSCWAPFNKGNKIDCEMFLLEVSSWKLEDAENKSRLTSLNLHG